MRAVYVYALVEARSRRPLTPPRARAMQVRGHRIQLIPVGTIQALVELLEVPPALSEESLRAQHDIVVALARRFDAILPARFGAAVDIAELERLVVLREKSLRKALARVRGREQMTVRVFGPEPQAGIKTGMPVSGTAYLHGRRQAARARVPASGRRIRRAVKSIMDRERIDTGHGRVQATLHHLIQRGRHEQYRALVRKALEGFPTDGGIVISGPWPPFAFTPDLWP